MSGLEKRAKPLLAPMIGGTSRILGAEDRRLVARWAVKTAITLNQTGKEAKYIEPYEIRKAVAETDRPPPEFQVYVNSPRGPGFWCFHEHAGVGWPGPDGLFSGTVKPNGPIHFVMAGRVLFQVVGDYRIEKDFATRGLRRTGLRSHMASSRGGARLAVAVRAESGST